MRPVRRTRLLIGSVTALTAALALTTPAQASGQSPHHVLAQGVFVDPAVATVAFAYDPVQIPAGARAQVQSWYLPDGRTVVSLAASGLQPDRAYGAHAHTSTCGATGALAGPHYQYAQDPVSPSIDPAFANPENEIWLDFTTDHQGRGWALAIQQWQPHPDRRPASVIIHQEHTHTGDDGFPPGSAGPRLACLSVGF